MVQVVTRAAVVREAREWVGTRFRHQHREKGSACDCAGLVAGVGRLCGALDVDTLDPSVVARHGNYGTVPNPRRMMDALREMMVPIRIEEAGAGDVVHMRFDPGLSVNPQHLCVLTGDGWRQGQTIVHALASLRRVVEHRLDAAWLARSHRAYRYPAVQRAVDEGVDR